MPEHIIHGLGGLDQEPYNLAIVFGQMGKVGLQAEDGVLVYEGPYRGFVVLHVATFVRGVGAPGEGDGEGQEEGRGDPGIDVRAGVHLMLLRAGGSVGRRRRIEAVG